MKSKELAFKLLDIADRVEEIGYEDVDECTIRDAADKLIGTNIVVLSSKLADELLDFADKMEESGLFEQTDYVDRLREAADKIMKNEKDLEYVLAFDATGWVQLFEVDSNMLDDLLIELEEEGKLFTVVANKVEDSELCLEAIKYKGEDDE